MGSGFWLKRFVLALLVAAALLFAVQLSKGHDVAAAASFAAIWGAISASIFSLVGFIRYRRNPACMLPRQQD